ncbi:unnamed protein product [Rhizophagus irregularis]|nr:unnamed protein product [Rhizophagus irregularis]
MHPQSQASNSQSTTPCMLMNNLVVVILLLYFAIVSDDLIVTSKSSFEKGEDDVNMIKVNGDDKESAENAIMIEYNRNL